VHADLVEVEPPDLAQERALLALTQQLRAVDEPLRRSV
jgi:hypothetical protein